MTNRAKAKLLAGLIASLTFCVGFSANAVADNCNYAQILVTQSQSNMQLDLNKRVKSKELIAQLRERQEKQKLTIGPTTLDARVGEVWEGEGDHIVIGECFLLAEQQPNNNLILLFQPAYCGATSKWQPGVYPARRVCGTTNVYRIKNAMVDGHLHTVNIWVDEFDANGLPEKYTYWFESDLATVIFDHPGHGSVR